MGVTFLHKGIGSSAWWSHACCAWQTPPTRQLTAVRQQSQENMRTCCASPTVQPLNSPVAATTSVALPPSALRRLAEICRQESLAQRQAPHSTALLSPGHAQKLFVWVDGPPDQHLAHAHLTIPATIHNSSTRHNSQAWPNTTPTASHLLSTWSASSAALSCLCCGA